MNARLETVLADFRARLQELYGPRLAKLVLFGSRARGDAEPDSDIDVMIVLDGPLDDWAETQRTTKVTSEVSIKYDTAISRVFATPSDADSEKAAFYENVRREGVAV